MNKIKNITEQLEGLNEEQLSFIEKLLKLDHANKHDLLKLAEFDTNKTYDTAYPVEYYRRIREVYPAIGEANLIYDYSEHDFGAMVNINDLVTSRIIKLFN